jgi:hypothetical protein
MFFVRLEPLIWRGIFADLRLYSSGFLEIEFGGLQEVVLLLTIHGSSFSRHPLDYFENHPDAGH